jgi:hypothetical protein
MRRKEGKMWHGHCTGSSVTKQLKLLLYPSRRGYHGYKTGAIRLCLFCPVRNVSLKICAFKATNA